MFTNTLQFDKIFLTTDRTIYGLTHQFERVYSKKALSQILASYSLLIWERSKFAFRAFLFGVCMNINNPQFAPFPKDARFENLTGQRFKRLAVLGYGGYEKKQSFWILQCDCGNVTRSTKANLQSGRMTSCGCWRDMRAVTHGETSHAKRTAEWTAFENAKYRCNRLSHPQYKDYGGRGIEFRFKNFQEFLAELGRKPSPKHQLDRINNNGHYEKGNVRWATLLQQNRNTRKNRYITHNNQTKAVSEWAEILGVTPMCIHRRRRTGWCANCLLDVTIHKCVHKNNE